MKLKIVKSAEQRLDDAKEVSRYLETIAPSLYKRDEFDKMFE